MTTDIFPTLSLRDQGGASISMGGNKIAAIGMTKVALPKNDS